MEFYKQTGSKPFPDLLIQAWMDPGAFHPTHTVLTVLYGTRLPLIQQGARLGMDCTADLLLNFVWYETASGTARSKTSVLLLTVPEVVLSHTKVRSRSAVYQAVKDTSLHQNLYLTKERLQQMGESQRCPGI